MIQLRLKVPVRRIRTDNGTEFVNQTLREYYEKGWYLSRNICSSLSTTRWNRTLIEVARTMLIYAKALLFLWAEAVATACYTQNRSIIRLRHGKTPYELLHDKLPDLSFHVFGALCYPTNDSENLGKLQPKADIGIFIGLSSHGRKKGISDLLPTYQDEIIETIHVDFDDADCDGLLNTTVRPALHVNDSIRCSNDEVAAPVPVYQQFTFLNIVAKMHHHQVNLKTTPEYQPPVIPNDVKKDNHDIEVAHMGNDPLLGIPIPEVPSDQSSSSDSIHTNVPPDHYFLTL
ncbi:retrovirus-related pol polyprotein from transposon TNT 1-94 [Tanacetum coccineum]